MPYCFLTFPFLLRNHLSLPHPVVDSARLFGRALQLADEAAEEETRGDALVAASVGPFGACRHDGSEYTGAYADSMSREELGEWHFERVKRLTAAGARFLAVETIPCVKEALAVLDVVKRFPGVRCWLTFQCREASCTARGERLDRAIRELLLHPAFPSQLSAVGVNCVAPEHVAPLLRLANKVNRYEEWEEHPDFRPLPYVVYPNSGEKWEGREWKGEKGDLDDDLVGRVPLWMKLGANVVGGCCRVGPDMISRIRDKVRECTFDVFEYRRKHASVDRRRGPEAVRRRMRELGELESRPKKEEVLVPSDLVGRTEMLPPGHVDKDLAEARLRAIFQHFEVKYPLDKEGGGADDEAEGGENEVMEIEGARK